MRILRSRVQDDEQARLADLEAAISLAQPGSPLAREAAQQLERLRAKAR